MAKDQKLTFSVMIMKKITDHELWLVYPYFGDLIQFRLIRDMILKVSVYGPQHSVVAILWRNTILASYGSPYTLVLSTKPFFTH